SRDPELNEGRRQLQVRRPSWSYCEHEFEMSFTDLTFSFVSVVAPAAVAAVGAAAESVLSDALVISTLWLAYLLRSTPSLATSVHVFGGACMSFDASVSTKLFPSLAVVTHPVTGLPGAATGSSLALASGAAASRTAKAAAYAYEFFMNLTSTKLCRSSRG